MKKTLLLIALFACVFANAQGLTPQQKTVVTDFINCFKNNDKEKLAGLVSLPLKRQYPIPSVKNKAELFKRFDEVFDSKLVGMIKASDIEKDWSAVGWRGIMLGNGEVWLDEEGRLTAVNHESPAETKMRESLIAAEKKTLHETVKYFSDPVCILLTKTYRIRIDNMGEGTYRYACWKRSAQMSKKPDLVIDGGSFEPDGSANYYYSFKNGDYVYNCHIDVIGAVDDPPAHLSVYKNEAEVLTQEADIVEP